MDEKKGERLLNLSMQMQCASFRALMLHQRICSSLHFYSQAIFNI